jgi:group I intron endonuclease
MGCIYAAVCFINGKIYIGQTINYIKRIERHQNSKDDVYFHRAIRKYGKENFGFCIIHDNIDIMWLDDWEIYYISKYDSYNRIKGYNSTPGGKCTRGVIPSLETRLKLSKAHKGRIKSEETCKKISESKKGCIISQETIDGLNIYRQSEKHKEQMKKLHESTRGKPLKKEHIEKLGKKVIQLDLNGNYLNTYDSTSEASRKTNVSRSGIGKCCNGRPKNKTSGGFIWKFVESNKQV